MNLSEHPTSSIDHPTSKDLRRARWMVDVGWFGWQRILGASLGIVIGFAIVALTGSRTSQPPLSGPILSESDGRLREVVIHYEPLAKDAVAAVYREFLGALDAGVTVHVVCTASNVFDELQELVGRTRCRLEPVITGHPITTWSRDRWVALGPASANSPTTIWSPRGEAAGGIWPARAGDERVGQDIAAALAPSVRAVRSGYYFDGGDLLADNENVFVVARVLQRNLQRTATDREEFLLALAAQLKRRVILLDKSPDHHAGMFMASIGGRVMLVGDPALGRELMPVEWVNSRRGGPGEFMGLPGGPDFSPATQQSFDAVAAQCAAAGYRVRRIPVVPACDGRTYLTYVNVLLDRAGERRIVYLPVYAGAEALNAAARAVWESEGYAVRTVDCTAVYRHFGCLHCLVNVLKRG